MRPAHCRLALIQECHYDSSAANRTAYATALRTAAAAGCQLALLPELHDGPYFCQHEAPDECDRAEPIPGPLTQWLGQLAAELRMVIVGSVFERRAAGLYHNTAVVLERDGQLVGRYRKLHIPDDPGFYEKFYFTPGDLGCAPIATSVGRLGVLVCWDQWFPEAARLMALGGADVLLYPTAIGWDRHDAPDEQQRQHEAWLTVQRGHAIANGLPVAACNRHGYEPHPTLPEQGIQFWGQSFICGPQGELLAVAPADGAALLMVTLDWTRTEQVRRMWPFLRDRRVDVYRELSQRYCDPT